MYANRHIIGNKRLDQLAIPGAHDAGMYKIHDTYLQRTDFQNSAKAFSPDATELKRALSFLGPAFTRWAKTQNRNAYDLLKGGVRYFDIRVAIHGHGQLATCHGVYGASLDEILEHVGRFSNEHPNEIIILGFNHFWDRQYQISHDKKPGAMEGLRDDKWELLFNSIEDRIGTEKLAKAGLRPTSTLNQIWTGKERVICNFAIEPPKSAIRAWVHTGLEHEGSWVGEVQEFNEFKRKTKAKINSFLPKTNCGLLAVVSRPTTISLSWQSQSRLHPIIQSE